MNTLKKTLRSWKDIDVVMCKLGEYIGLFEKDASVNEYKAFFWTNNPISKVLHAMLNELQEIGAIEYNEEELQYRWNKKFDVNEVFKNGY